MRKMKVAGPTDRSLLPRSHLSPCPRARVDTHTHTHTSGAFWVVEVILVAVVGGVCVCLWGGCLHRTFQGLVLLDWMKSKDSSGPTLLWVWLSVLGYCPLSPPVLWERLSDGTGQSWVGRNSPSIPPMFLVCVFSLKQGVQLLGILGNSSSFIQISTKCLVFLENLITSQFSRGGTLFAQSMSAAVLVRAAGWWFTRGIFPPAGYPLCLALALQSPVVAFFFFSSH